MTPDGSHLSVAQAAELLGCDRSTVQRRIYRGEIPAQRIGNTWIIARVDLEESAA